MTEELSPTRRPLFQWFSRGHAVGMLAAMGVSSYCHRAWPSAIFAACSGASFLALNRSAWTPSGRFGLANAVTSIRLLLVLGLTAPPESLTARTAALVTVGILLLDALDGRLARSRGDASAFGAHFDMETDSVLVLTVCSRLWLAEGYAIWVLAPGLFRYLYVLGIWLTPGSGREAPRSLLGRYAFFVLMMGLLGGLLLPRPSGTLCVALGTVAVSYSFARSFYFSHSAN